MSTTTKDVSIKEDGTYITGSNGKSNPYKVKCTVSLTRNHGESFSTLIVENIQGMSGWGDVSDWRIVVTANGVSETVYHIGYNSVSYNKDGKHKQYKWYDFPSDITLTVPVGSNSGTLNISIKFEVGQGWKTNQDKSPNISLVDNEYIAQMQYESMGASTISSISNITLGEYPSIKFTPYSTSFYYKLKFYIGDFSYTTSPFNCPSASEYTYSSFKIHLEVANYITDSTVGTISAELFTYSDSNCTEQIGGSSVKTFTATVPLEIVPTISNLSMTLVNSNTTINSWNEAVSGFTKLKFTCNASGSYGSKIKSFKIKNLKSSDTVCDVTQGASVSLNYTSDVITITGNKSFTVSAIDTRGRESSTLTTTQIQIYPYSNPSISSFSADRAGISGDESEMLISTVACVFASINSKNSVTCKLYYQRNGSIAWDECATIQDRTPSNITIDGGFKKDNAYKIKVVVTDSIGNKAEQTVFVSTLNCFMDWREGGKGIGLGMMSEGDGLWCKMPAYFVGGLSIRVEDGASFTDYTLKEYINGVINGTI